MKAFMRHCEKTTPTPIEGTTTGTIPKWLEGTLIRNGPGIYEVGPYTYNHTLDGLAVLRRIQIADGKALFSCRELNSDAYRRNMEAQRIVVGEFGTNAIPDPCATLFASRKNEFEEGNPAKAEEPLRDNCLINVVYYGDQLFALSESNHTRRVDPETLHTIGEKTRINDYLVVNTASAHPHICEDGTVVNIGHHWSHAKGPHYAFFKVPPKFNSEESCFKDAKKIVEIPVQTKTPSYFHSFGITKDKIIFAVNPLRLNQSKMFTKDGKRSELTIKDCYEWNSDQKTRFYVASMETGEIHPIVYEAEGLCVFHHANAYEEDGHLVVDLSGYDDGRFIIENMDRDTMDSYSSGGSGRRYILPLNPTPGKAGNLITLKNSTATAVMVEGGNGTVLNVTPQLFYDKWFELPRINYKYNGKKYRYVYGMACSRDTGFPEGDILVKVDHETGEIKTWKEKNVMTEEPIFVHNPTIQNPAEDDGVLLCPLLHTDALKKVTLLILDAKTFKEVGRVAFTGHGTTPFTIHGQWANANEKIHSN